MFSVPGCSFTWTHTHNTHTLHTQGKYLLSCRSTGQGLLSSWWGWVQFDLSLWPYIRVLSINTILNWLIFSSISQLNKSASQTFSSGFSHSVLTNLWSAFKFSPVSSSYTQTTAWFSPTLVRPAQDKEVPRTGLEAYNPEPGSKVSLW